MLEFLFAWPEFTKIPSFSTCFFLKMTTTVLGRTLLLTNRLNLSAPEVIRTYRDLSHIEEAFKYMKNRDYLRCQPAFHWTDQKLDVHSLYCILALLFTTLARKTACKAGVDISLPALLDELSSIKQVALMYSEDGRVKADVTLSRMSSRQKNLPRSLTLQVS